MTKCDFQTQVTILISDVLETLLQFFASVMVKLILYLNSSAVLACRGKECSISTAANG